MTSVALLTVAGVLALVFVATLLDGSDPRDVWARGLIGLSGLILRPRRSEFRGELDYLRAHDLDAALTFAFGTVIGASRERVSRMFSIFNPRPNRWALPSGLDLNVRPGSATALLGAHSMSYAPFLPMLEASQVGYITVGDVDIRPAASDQDTAIIRDTTNLLDHMTVVENLALRRVEGWLIRHDEERDRARAALDWIGSSVDVDHLAGWLDPVQRLEVIIARDVVLTHASVVALDEPFAGMSDESVERALATLSRLQRNGVGVLINSHQVDTVFRFADRVAVLHDDSLVYDGPTDDTTPDQVIRQLAGSD